jgi:hypothetical protein
VEERSKILVSWSHDMKLKVKTWGTKDVVGAKYDEEGKLIGVLDGKGGNSLDSVSEVEEHNGYLWIGSAVKPYVGVIRA